MSKSLALAQVNLKALRQLIERIQAAGQQAPSPAMRSIGWVPAHGLWRVQPPAACGGGQHYFSPRNYGGVEAALVQALLWRDEHFAKAGYDLHARVAVTRKRGLALPVMRQLDSRGKHVVRGWWMDTDAADRPRQRTVTRSLGNRCAQEAWAQVEQIVQQGIEREARKARAATQAAFRGATSGQVESPHRGAAAHEQVGSRAAAAAQA